MSGYATSVIACDAEAAIERMLDARRNARRPPRRERLAVRVQSRCARESPREPRRPVRDDLPDDRLLQRPPDRRENRSTSAAGSAISATVGRSPSDSKAGVIWRVPVMDGEFTCEEIFGTTKGVAGGNIMLLGCDAGGTLRAAEAAADAMRACPDVILPFPGGIARSGSKVGSKYKTLEPAPTPPSHRRCVDWSTGALPAEVRCVYEIVIDGLTLEAVERATAVGLRAACDSDLSMISAGNYGGKLGPFHIRLTDVLNRF